jgi:hypothetical protein
VLSALQAREVLLGDDCRWDGFDPDGQAVSPAPDGCNMSDETDRLESISQSIK